MGKANATKLKIAVIDLETDPFKYGRIPRPFLGVFVSDEITAHAWGDDCIDTLFDERVKGFNGIIYAHNGGNFDWHFFLDRIWPLRPEIFCIGKRIVSLKFKNVELRDSYNILPIALKLTESKDEIDYKYFEKEVRESHKVEIIKYALNDARVTLDYIKSFVDEFGMGLTLANRSFNELRKLGLAPKATISKVFDNEMRKFFFGGRVQYSRLGCIAGDIKYADLNSAYPYAMTHQHAFTRDRDILFEPRADQVKGADFVSVTCHSKGALPLRDRKTKKVTYPTGEYYFHITGWEFLAAERHGLIDDIRIKYLYKFDCLKSFKPFVDKFYERKKNAKDPKTYLLNKLILNSCYGKFGMDSSKHKKQILAPTGDDLEPEGFLHKHIFFEAGLTLWEKPTDFNKQYFYNVATASSITGFVRGMLIDSIQSVTDFIYCDTDSIIYRGRGDLNFSDELGDWKIEASGKKIYIGGKKLYAMDTTDGWKTASKGCHLTPGEIIKVTEGNEIIWKNQAPTLTLKKACHFIDRKIRSI